MPEAVSLADRIRENVRTRHIDPARHDGRKTVTLRAGDIVPDMGLNNRTPAVCSALGSKLFLREAGLRLVERIGPRQSTTTEFRFEILDQSSDEPIPVSTERGSAPSRPARVAPKRRSTPDMGSTMLTRTTTRRSSMSWRVESSAVTRRVGHRL